MLHCFLLKPFIVAGTSVLILAHYESLLQYSNGPVVKENLPTLDTTTPSDHEDSASLEDLTSSNANYKSFTLKGTNDMGCSLRYFSIEHEVCYWVQYKQ